LERPTSGTITFDGRQTTGYPPHKVSRLGIAMVQQTPRVFPSMSVLENATLGGMFGAEDAHRPESDALPLGREMLSLVGLGDRHGEQVGNLNLHERRFLELARALAGQPKLILLDEVMAGLNETELAASVEIVRNIRDKLGTTILWVEHVMSAVIQLAERAIVLNFGKVLAEGAPEVVMRDPKVVDAYLGRARVA
jgi:ABC-type branched-subunit amino acid transport system ATPase component